MLLTCTSAGNRPITGRRHMSDVGVTVHLRDGFRLVPDDVNDDGVTTGDDDGRNDEEDDRNEGHVELKQDSTSIIELDVCVHYHAGRCLGMCTLRCMTIQ